MTSTYTTRIRELERRERGRREEEYVIGKDEEVAQERHDGVEVNGRPRMVHRITTNYKIRQSKSEGRKKERATYLPAAIVLKVPKE